MQEDVAANITWHSARCTVPSWAGEAGRSTTGMCLQMHSVDTRMAVKYQRQKLGVPLKMVTELCTAFGNYSKQGLRRPGADGVRPEPAEPPIHPKARQDPVSRKRAAEESDVESTDGASYSEEDAPPDKEEFPMPAWKDPVLPLAFYVRRATTASGSLADGPSLTHRYRVPW